MRLVVYTTRRDATVRRFQWHVVAEDWTDVWDFVTLMGAAEPAGNLPNTIDLGFGFSMDEEDVAKAAEKKERKEKKRILESDSGSASEDTDVEAGRRRRKLDRERLYLGGDTSDGSASDVPKPRPAAPVPVPAPPAPIAPRPRGRGRGRGGRGEHSYPKIPVYRHGDRVGAILYNENSSSVDAHCHVHGASCAVSRSIVRWDGVGNPTPLRLSKGRPLGFLVAWLFIAKDYGEDEHGRDDHFLASRDRSVPSALLDGTSALRLEARAYVENEATLAPLRAVEGIRRPGEPQEPPHPL